MHLLLITNVFPSPWHPTKGTFNLELARALAREHEVRVVCPIAWLDEWRVWRKTGQRPCPDRQAVIDGIPVFYPRYYYTPGMLRSRYGWFLWRSVARTVRRLLAEKTPDVVLGYWAHPDGEVAVRTARRAGVPAVIVVGGSDLLLLTESAARRRVITRVLEQADAVVTVSHNLREKIVGYGINPNRVHVVYRGVDVTRFCPGDREHERQLLGLAVEGRHLLWVGRMVPVKGLEVLLEACARLRDRGATFRLNLVGDGPLRPSLEADARARRLSGFVSFAGACPHDQLPHWYRAADFTVLSSHSEGVPNVLRESLACGTPFVSTRVGGVAELAGGPPNRLVPPGDPAALAEALEQALGTVGTVAPTNFPVTGSAEAVRALLEVVRPLVAATPGHGPASPSGARGGMVRVPNPWRQAVRGTLTALLPRRFVLARGPGASRSVCLTFDDGPDPEHTPPLLEVLRQAGVRATFFVIGERAQRHPELIRRLAAEGHTIGNHTFTHSEPARTSAAQLAREVEQTQTLVAELTGASPSLFRPPHGRVTAAKLWRLWRARQTVVLWNVDPRDWACRESSDVRDWFRKRPLRGGDVVLLHDNHPHAAAVLPEVIASARQQGLSFGQIPDWTS